MTFIVVNDPRVDHALMEIDGNPNEAANLLLIASEYIRLNQQMPPELQTYLCQAIENSMKEKPSDRGKALAKELKLTQKGAGRIAKVVSEQEIAELYDLRLKEGLKQSDTNEMFEAKYGISAITARRYWMAWKAKEEARQAFDEMQDEEM